MNDAAYKSRRTMQNGSKMRELLEVKFTLKSKRAKDKAPND
jgi:hypothetical protein